MTGGLRPEAGRKGLWDAGPITAADSTPSAQSTPIVVPERPAAVTIGLLLVLLIVAIDVALGSGLQITGLLTTPPFVAAVFVNPRRTAFVALASIAANVILAHQADLLFDNSQLVRLAGVVIAGAGAVALSVVREREQQRALTVAHIAEVAQLAVLRTLPPIVGPARLGVRYVSASAQARVGGDFYEALRTDTGMRALVGDVRGKGLGSVQLANVLIGAFRGADHDGLALDVVAADMDSAFIRFEPSDEDFATAVLVELGADGRLTVVNCGHPAPLGIAGPVVRSFDPERPALPLGLGSRPQPAEFHLDSTERLLLFTDGITEARHRGVMFDLVAHAPVVAQGSIDAGLDGLVDALHRFVGPDITDDVALMLIERG